MPGVSCPSDSNAMAGSFATPISYRANTGDDPSGLGGPFQPGQLMTSAQIEAADGLSYTAAFAERLVGDGQDNQPALGTMRPRPARSASAVVPMLRTTAGKGMPARTGPKPPGDRRSTTTSSGPMRVRRASPTIGRTALMGASSGHVNRVNVLMMDGSLRGVTPTIDPKVWQALGTVGTPVRSESQERRDRPGLKGRPACPAGRVGPWRLP